MEGRILHFLSYTCFDSSLGRGGHSSERFMRAVDSCPRSYMDISIQGCHFQREYHHDRLWMVFV